ncbi:formimidoylglutamate deiminase [Rhizobium sp.]
MMAIFAEQVLTADGWFRDARVVLDAGRIVSVTANVMPEPGDERHAILVPGMSNVHSHAFQRAMAGLTEMPGPGSDNFWSWRDLMYRFALSFDPDQIEAVAAQLYVEMLEAGFTRVGEFHYLHHARDGSHYDDIAEHSARIAAAAGATGIGLTLLPVFYAHSQFGGQPPGEGQRRFINDVSNFARLLEGAQKAVQSLNHSRVGIAPHSLRAATIEEIKELQQLRFDGPIHIHIAEQMKEVEDSIAFSGKRPVDYMLENSDADRRWCFIHATHMTDAETIAMAKRGVVAGLCPITEANLGDGFFQAPLFLAHGGEISVGSDSNVQIGVAAELRQLEYSQRPLHRARNVIASKGRSTGRTLYDEAVAGGGRALMHETGIVVGMPADFVSLKPVFDVGYRGDQVLDAHIFGEGMRVADVWVHGEKVVAEGRHRDRERIGSRFAGVMRALLSV